MSKLNANILFLLVLTIFFSACTQTKKTEDQYMAAAKTLLDSATAKNDNNLFTEAINTYKEFLKEYPNSSNALSAYMQIGEIYTDNLKNYNEAINIYKEVINKYADKKEAMNSMFMIAFIYDNYLNDKQNAKDAYKKFLDKFPETSNPEDSYKRESAKVMLEALEKNIPIDSLIMNKVESNNANKEKVDTTKKDEKKKDANVKTQAPNDQAPSKTDDKKK